VMCGVLPWIKPWSAAPGQNVSQNVGHKSPVLRMQRHPAVVHPQSGLGNAKVPNVQARPSKPTAMWARASSAGSGAPRSSWRVRADRTRGRGGYIAPGSMCAFLHGAQQGSRGGRLPLRLGACRARDHRSMGGGTTWHAQSSSRTRSGARRL
jgi:hypothetical protein